MPAEVVANWFVVDAALPGGAINRRVREFVDRSGLVPRFA
jgi:hypothetical protein